MMKLNLKHKEPCVRDISYSDFIGRYNSERGYKRCINNASIVKNMVVHNRNLGSLHHGNTQKIYKILEDCMRELYEMMCNNGDYIKLPYRMGYFIPVRYISKNGVRCGDTMRMWYEDEEAFVDRKRLKSREYELKAIVWQRHKHCGSCLKYYIFKNNYRTLLDINKRDVVSYMYKKNLKFNIK